jgi:hypothetical protein
MKIKGTQLFIGYLDGEPKQKVIYGQANLKKEVY